MSLLLTGAGSSSPGISSPVGLAGCSLWARPGQDTVLTGGGQTFVDSDKIHLTMTSKPNPGTGSWAVECWYKHLVTGTSWLFSTGAVTDGRDGFTCIISSGDIPYVYVCDSVQTTSSKGTIGDGALTLGVWYHLLFVFDRSAGLAKCYVNGVLQTVTVDISAHTATLGAANGIIARRENTSTAGSYCDGSLACLRYWPTLLTQDDATYLYNNKNPRYYGQLSAAYVTKLGTGHNWNLDEPLVGDPTYVTGASATVRDQHGSNDLTFTNAEMVTNGTMDSDTGWTKGTGWTVDAGDSNTAASDGSQSADADLEQSCPCVTGQKYLTAIVIARTSGKVCVVVGGTEGTDRETSNTFTQVVTVASTNNKVAVRADADFVGTVDTYSVKAVNLTACNGPSTAIASDSIGTLHGTLTGFSQSGEIVNWIPRGDDYALYFDGTDDNLACGNAGNVTHVAFDVKSAVANQELFTLANSTATAVTVVAGTLTFGASLTASSITVDGVSKTAAQAGALINDGSWHTVEFDLTSIAASNLKLATDSSAYGNVYLDNFTVSLSGSATHTYTFADGPQANPTDGDPVLGLLSSEGSLLKFDQSTLSARPEYEFATTGLNNQPSIKFDGVDSFLRLAQNFAPTDTAGTLFIVWLTSDDVTTEQVLLGTADEASATKFWRLGIASGGLKYNQNDAGTADTLTGGTIATTTAYLIMVQSTGAANGFGGTINNAAVASWTAASGANNGDWLGDTSARDSLCLGASNANATAALFAKGYLGEVFYFNRILNASEIRRVNRYITKLWGITL